MFRPSARIYDAVYSWKDYPRETALVHELVQARKPGASTLLDVACGTGAHLAELRRWYRCEGVDLEPLFREQFVLAASEQGFGKRTSSYEYRVTGRGGSGIVAMAMGAKNSAIVAAFAVEDSDHLMLITNQGQTIRVPVAGISIQRRAAQGVTLFRLDEGERVVSVERIADSSGEGEE